MNVLAACGGADYPVRKVVFKSSAALLRRRAGRPGLLHRGHAPPAPAAHADRARHRRGRARRARVRARHPRRHRHRRCASPTAWARRCAPRSAELFGLPAVPTILGFDPRFQFIHEDDLAGCLEHAVRHDLDGRLQLRGRRRARPQRGRSTCSASSCCRCCRRWGTGLAASALRRAGVRIPPEMLSLLRFGRGLDNRRLKATGYRYRYTTRETVLKLREYQRLAPLVARRRDAYRYEARGRGVPAPQPERAPPTAPGGPTRRREPERAGERRGARQRGARPRAGYADLSADELIALLPSARRPTRGRARATHERARRGAGPTVLEAIEPARPGRDARRPLIATLEHCAGTPNSVSPTRPCAPVLRSSPPRWRCSSCWRARLRLRHARANDDRARASRSAASTLGGLTPARRGRAWSARSCCR